MRVTLPKEGGLADRNRAERRFNMPKSETDRVFSRAFRGIVSRPERYAIARAAAAGVRAGDQRTYAHPQARKIARIGRQMEATLMARELYPVIDRARGLAPRP